MFAGVIRKCAHVRIVFLFDNNWFVSSAPDSEPQKFNEQQQEFLLNRNQKMSNSKCVKQLRKNYIKEQQEMSHSEKLRLIDDELNAFYK